MRHSGCHGSTSIRAAPRVAEARHSTLRRGAPGRRRGHVADVRRRRESPRARRAEGGAAPARRIGRVRGGLLPDVRQGRGRGRRPRCRARPAQEAFLRHQGLDQRARSRRPPDGAVLQADAHSAHGPHAGAQPAGRLHSREDAARVEGRGPYPLSRHHPLPFRRLFRARAPGEDARMGLRAIQLFDGGTASWAQFFIKYILAHPAVTCAIPGTRRVSHLRDNLQAGAGRLPDAATRRRMVEYLEQL